MKYILDTNACVHCLRKKGSALVKVRLAAQSAGDIAVGAITAADLYYGAARSANPAAGYAQTAAFTSQFTVLDVTEAVAAIYGTIRADLERAGTIIGPNDLLIAATALEHGLILVTHNTKEFSRVPGLVLDDWEIP